MGWRGVACEESLCGCSGHGKCLYEGEPLCFCEDGWGGEFCQMPLAGAVAKRCLNDCHGHGFCDPILGLCRCLQAYDGADCRHDQHVTCPNQCSGHGRCSQQGLCYCMPDFQGADCSERLVDTHGQRQAAAGEREQTGPTAVAVRTDGTSTGRHQEGVGNASVEQLGGGGDHGESDARALAHGGDEADSEALEAAPNGQPPAMSGSKTWAAPKKPDQSDSIGEAKQAVARAHQGLRTGRRTRAERQRHGWAGDESHFPLVQLATWLFLFALAAVFFFGQQRRGPRPRPTGMQGHVHLPPAPARGPAGLPPAPASSAIPGDAHAGRAAAGGGEAAAGVKES